MADYSIQLGVKVDTKGIDTAINKYQKESIEVKSKLDTSGIDKKIASYKAKKPIEINTKLNTSGLAKKISEYKPKTPIKLNAKLDTKNIGTAIKNYKTKTPIKVDIKLDSSDISKQIRAYKSKTPIKVDIKLDSSDITKQIRVYQAKAPIKLSVKLTTKDIDEKIRAYKAKTPIKLDVKINKGVINEQIKSFNPKNTIKLNVALQKGAIAEEIRKFKPTTPIKVDLELNYSDIDKKVGEYAAKGGVVVPAKLVPASKGFDSSITKKPVEVSATLETNDINNIIDNFKATSKIKVDVQLVPKDVNAQVAKLQKPTETLTVDVNLDESSINSSIALFQPTATLGVKPDLILEDVDDQIRAYVPKAQVKVNIKLGDNDIDEEIGKPSSQPPVTINVKLDHDDINSQIKSFKTQSKIKVGVKLDFASHKDDAGNEIQKGVSKQIKDYDGKAKIKVCVKLNTNGIGEQIEKIDVGTPVKVDLKLNVENAQSQINDIKEQLQELNNITINLGNTAGSGRGNDRNVNISDNTTSNDNLSDVEASNVVGQLREVNVVIETTEGNVQELKSVLSSIGFNDSSIESLIADYKELGITVKNVASTLNGDGSTKLIVRGINEAGDAITAVTKVDKDGIASGTSISRTLNEAEKAFSRLKTLSTEISRLSIKIELSDNEYEIQSLTSHLRELQYEYFNLFNSTDLTKNQKEELGLREKELAKQLQDIRAKIRGEDKKSVEEIKIDINAGGDIDKKIQFIKSEMSKLSNTPIDLSGGLEEAERLIKQINETPSYQTDKIKSDYEELEQVLKRINNLLAVQKKTEQDEKAAKKADDDAKKLEDRKNLLKLNIEAWLAQNTAAADKFGDKLREILSQIDACDKAGLDHLESEFKQVDKRADSLNLKGKTFGEKLKDQFSKYSQYFSVSSLYMYAEQGLRSMFEQVKLVDSAMTELKKVTNETDSTYNAFLKNAATKSKEIGTTIDGFVSSTADFARLGYDFEESQGLAEVANIYAVVGDEIDGVEGATQSLVSTLAAFKDEASGISDTDFAMSIVDKFNEVSNNFAISSGGIGEAMERSASSLRAANNTIDESIAMITAANEVTQNPEKVGNAMKTISMRMKIHCPQ